jgi:hypothetical protein
MVGKIRRGDRKYLPSGRAFGRLCDECVTDLFHGQTALRHNPGVGHVKLTVVRDRDVA